MQISLRAILIFVIGVALVRAATRALGKWGAFDIILAVMVGPSLASVMTGGALLVPMLTARGYWFCCVRECRGGLRAGPGWAG